MKGDVIDDGSWQVPVKLFGGAGELEGRGQRGILTFLQPRRNDVDTDLIVFVTGYGQQGCTLPQEGDQFLEHRDVPGVSHIGRDPLLVDFLSSGSSQCIGSVVTFVASQA